MRNYLIILVMSVFLGSEILSISTPVAQITPYRVLIFGLVLVFIYKLHQEDPKLKINPKAKSTSLVSLYLVWWLWGALSVVWAVDFKSWLQAMFLLTIGVIAVVGIYFWTLDMRHFKQLATAMWWMILFLMIWGYYEILTNNYLFANMEKLDKHGVFANNPMKRIPITFFSNQNDYATMLLSFIPLSIIKYKFTNSFWGKVGILSSLIPNVYLVYRSGSRMILLSLVLYLLVYLILQFDVDLQKKDYYKLIGLGVLFVSLVLIFIPKIRNTISGWFYFNEQGVLSGDTKRMSLWRNGFIYLATTLGLGVGAGNVEEWIINFNVIPTDDIVNMHNWWLEILVGYGIIVFVLYLVIYFGLIRGLYRSRKLLPTELKQVSNSFIAFLIVYIFASITSSNNMNIEWHWVFFGLIFAYLKLIERDYKSCANISSRGEFR